MKMVPEQELRKKLFPLSEEYLNAKKITIMGSIESIECDGQQFPPNTKTLVLEEKSGVLYGKIEGMGVKLNQYRFQVQEAELTCTGQMELPISKVLQKNNLLFRSPDIIADSYNAPQVREARVKIKKGTIQIAYA